jgi:hypothetical protein
MGRAEKWLAPSDRPVPRVGRLENSFDQPHIVDDREPGNRNALVVILFHVIAMVRLWRRLPWVTITPRGAAVEPDVY